MRKLIILLTIVFVGCTFEVPTQFSEKALEENISPVHGDNITFKEVLTKYKGKKIVIDVWASWCGDCIKGLPAVKNIQKEYPEVVFLFLSVDRNERAWKRGIQRFKIVGEHYRLPKGMKDGDLVDFLNVSWIPRYIVVGEDGKIEVFKATRATDKRIVEALKK